MLLCMSASNLSCAPTSKQGIGTLLPFPQKLVALAYAQLPDTLSPLTLLLEPLARNSPGNWTPNT